MIYWSGLFCGTQWTAQNEHQERNILVKV
jgi:hypothetical protein